nr:hypothetical protein [Tanacetum cinerariifolium]
GIDIPTGSYFIPTAGPPVVDIHTGSDAVPTASPIVATDTIVTPYSRRKGKIARNAEVVRIHVEEELQGMIDSLDRTNETIVKYLQEYQDFASELPLERRIELISDLVKYQDNYLKIYKFQSQQRRPWTKKQKKDYYMTVIKNNLGWKVKDFKAKRVKRKGFNLEQEKAKKQKTSEEVPDKEKSPKEIPEEKGKEMMQLILIEEVGSKETHLKAKNYTKSFGKETQAWVYTDCHLGNPCDPKLHPTAQDFDQMKDLEGLAAIKGALVLDGKSSN